jgi:alpha-tubulin suppressor-like RCC1 family protein
MKSITLIFFSFFCVVINAQCWNKLATTEVHTLGIQSNGSLWAWGLNEYGQLGNGNTISTNYPIQIGNELNWKDCSTSDWTSFGIKIDGSLWAWGDNNSGIYGDGTTTSSQTPIQIGTDINWNKLHCSRNHCLALKNDGTLWAWGNNFSGQLGDNSTTNRLTPIQVGSANNWIEIQAGDGLVSIALNTQGNLYSWGNNGAGQLGLGWIGNPGSLIPQLMPNFNNISKISLTTDHGMAIKNDGTLWVWGGNDCYQLGNSTTNNSGIPIQIDNSINWNNIAAGYSESIATKNDGTMWGWGCNYEGQLGNGTSNIIVSPIYIGIYSDWSKPLLGINHSLILKNNGSLYASGSNLFGQLGDNSNIDRLVHMPITQCTNSSISEMSNLEKKLIRVTDLIGRETIPTSENIYLYHYSDGSIEKKMFFN